VEVGPNGRGPGRRSRSRRRRSARRSVRSRPGSASLLGRG